MKLRTLILVLFSLPSITWADTVINSFPTLANGKYTLDDGTTYMLTEDFNPSGYIEIPSGATVTIDLNGCTINRNLTSPTGWGMVIYNNGGNLTITDTKDGGGGLITGGYNRGPGSGIYNNNGTLTILNGTISGNHAYNNNTSYEDQTGYGGGIYIFAGTLNLFGGNITSNIADQQGGGVYIRSGELHMKDSPTITGNTKGGSTNNLYLQNDRTIILDGSLSGSQDVGITMQNLLGTFTSGSYNTGNYLKFFSDVSAYEPYEKDGQAEMQTCWKGVVNAINAGQNVTLSSAKVYTAHSSDPCITVPSDKSVTLNLNGQTLNRNLSNAKEDGCAIKNLGTLTISGSGIITGGTNSSGGGGIHNTGILSISEATIRVNTSTNLGGGIHNTGTMTISGGTIEDNTASNTHGGGIYNSGTLNISGGTISSNTANGTNRDGGGIYCTNSGILNISGGTIQSNTATRNGAGVYHNNTSANSFNVHGAPLISLNTVSNKANNVYLGTGSLITVDGVLTNTTAIGIIMETLGVFTSGLNSPGSATSAKFSSDINDSAKLIDSGGEAMLQSYWSYLNSLLGSNGSYALEEGKIYKASSTESYLHVPSGVTFTIYLDGNTLDRNLSEAIADGCVIYNEGTLTITKNAGKGTGTIKGGNNNDAGSLKGGGICNAGILNILDGTTISNNATYSTGSGIYNAGTLSIQGGSIQSNTVTTADGGGIYHNGFFKLQGGPAITNNKSNSVARNVYLASGKTITISGTLSNSTAIGIASADEYLVFTNGLSTYDGLASKFVANQDGKGIGLNSSGEAIIGHAYNIERSNSVSGPSASLYIKGAVSGSQTAVEGEVIKVKVVNSDGGVPVSIGYSPGSDLSPYPKSNVEYSFTMPASDVTVEAVSCWGGYCGAGSLEDIKYFLDGETLKFITKDDAADYSMVSYGAGAAPWVNKTYTSVFIPKRLGAISDYAFCDKNKKLTTFTVHADNSSFKAVGDLLFSKDENTLICYPSGKDASTYTVPSSVTVIKDGAFAFNTSLQSFTVAGGSYYSAGSDGVLYNADGTVLICYPAGKAETLYTIESNVIEIKPYAFQSCSNLDYVYVLRTSGITTGNTAMFDGTKNSLKILVPNTVLTTYKGAEYWSNYASKIFAIDGSNFEIVLTDNKNAYDYSGSPVTPDVIQVRSLAGDGYILVKGVDYKSTYEYTNNNALGTGTITITGLGNYAGINPSTTFDITKKVVITGASGHYSTYYHAETEVLTIPDGLQAYTITGINWENGTTEINSVSCIPQNTPVLLYKSNGNCNGEYHLKVTTGSVDVVDTGFKGKSDKDSEESRSFGTLNSGFKAIYVLKGDKFYRAIYGTLGTNRCYLAQPNSAGSRGLDVISIGSGDGTTTINQVGKEELSDETWYDLQGRRLGAKPTIQGVYISNGKKIVIK